MRQVSGAFHPGVLAVVHELKAYRLMMGISVKELAKRMGIGEMTIHNWEHERRMPDMINLEIWASALGYILKVSIESP